MTPEQAQAYALAFLGLVFAVYAIIESRAMFGW